MISQVDHWVGEIAACLRTRGLDRSTIVIYTADHGLARGSHGLLGKQNLYEHSLKVPLVIQGPGVPAGKRSAAPVYLSELFPTILDYAGCDLPANQGDGSSLRPLVEGKPGASRRITYHAYTGVLRGVVDGPWKLIESRNRSGRFTQLFEVGKDPHELANLADDPGYGEDLARLRKILWQQKSRFGDHDSAFWRGNDLVPPGEEEELAGTAEIHWQAAADTTGISDLIEGDPVHAVTGSARPVTVGGIAFAPYDLGSGVLEDVYAPRTIASTGDRSFDQLISSFTYGGGAGEVLHTLRGLKPGESYTVQVFYNDQRASCSGRTMTFRDAAGNTARVGAGKAAGPQSDDYGQHAIGTFVAESDTQVLSLSPYGFRNSHVNAILVTGPPANAKSGPSSR